MADTKISALPSATTPLAETELIACVQSSTTKKVTVANVRPSATAYYSLYVGTGINATEVGDQVSGSLTDATNASPIVVTASGHTMRTGTHISITGVVGNTAANGTWIVTRIDQNTFSLNGSTGNGAYVSGGTWVQLDTGNIGIGGMPGILANNTTGYGNIGIGNASLDGNPDPHVPLASCTTGEVNIGIGGSALGLLTTGYGNIGIGDGALAAAVSASNNVAIGAYASWQITTGNGNVCVGSNTAANLTSGSFCVYIGTSSGPNYGSSTGTANTCVGQQALSHLTSGNNNTSIGSFSTQFLTTGSGNAAVGNGAFNSLTTGSDNVGVGKNGLTGLLTGSFNVGVGAESHCAADGSYNTAVGYNAGAGTGVSDGIAIGHNAAAAEANTCVFGSGVQIALGANAAPADASISAGQVYIWMDSNNTTPAVKFKGKKANGTVVTATVLLT